MDWGSTMLSWYLFITAIILPLCYVIHAIREHTREFNGRLNSLIDHVSMLQTDMLRHRERNHELTGQIALISARQAAVERHVASSSLPDEEESDEGEEEDPDEEIQASEEQQLISDIQEHYDLGGVPFENILNSIREAMGNLRDSFARVGEAVDEAARTWPGSFGAIDTSTPGAV